MPKSVQRPLVDLFVESKLLASVDNGGLIAVGHGLKGGMPTPQANLSTACLDQTLIRFYVDF